MPEQNSPLLGEPFSFHNYHLWLEKLKENPLAHGIRGLSILAASLFSALAVVLLIFSILPPGRYPQILLILIVVGVGMGMTYLYGLLLHRLPFPILCAVTTIVSLGAGAISWWWLIKVIYG